MVSDLLHLLHLLLSLFQLSPLCLSGLILYRLLLSGDIVRGNKTILELPKSLWFLWQKVLFNYYKTLSDNGLAVIAIGDNIQFVIFIVIIFNFSTFMVKIYYIYSEPDYYSLWLKFYYIHGQWFITFMVGFYYIMVDFYNIYS